jgi:hypothetical protein
MAKTILRVRPTHGFCVVELSGSSGEMDQNSPCSSLASASSPSSATTAGCVWIARRHCPDRKLVAALPATGAAVLNADDERVIAMGADCAAKVISYGATRRTARRRHGSAWPIGFS